uniref:Uncharacterized protein n=1 Tax=Peronospora matthiolae TaxID=2874970 RepID=A0AAV1TLZ8_9STRA
MDARPETYVVESAALGAGPSELLETVRPSTSWYTRSTLA